MTRHISTKHKVSHLKPKEFEAVMNAAMFSEKERRILRLIYCEKKPLGFVADITGYAESTIRLKHRQMIERISEII